MKRIEELVDATAHEWEFAWTKARLLQLIQHHDNLVLCFNKGELYVVVEVVRYASGNKALRFVWSNGTAVVKFAAEAMEALETVAKTLKCQRLELVSRGGWGRILESFGVCRESVNYYKDIS
jgi:hypothetical protein